MSRHTMAERPHLEMMEKSHFRETFFSVKNIAQQRPDSVHTEFMETDWDEDDILSELEDDEASPRLSLDSVSHLKPPGTKAFLFHHTLKIYLSKLMLSFQRYVKHMEC